MTNPFDDLQRMADWSLYKSHLVVWWVGALICIPLVFVVLRILWAILKQA